LNRLPPGQIETGRFPVVGERRPSMDLLAEPHRWVLQVAGSVEQQFSVDFDEFLAIGREDLTFDIHCVTSWTRFGSTFTGIPLRILLERAIPRPSARFVSFHAYSERNHHTSLPLDVALANTWIVHSFQGEPLAVEHGGPVRVVTPGRYFYKSIKWLRLIEVLEDDRLGWWEENSFYHNNGDPSSGIERFSSGSIRPDQLQRFLDAPGYDKYRGRVLLGLDLRQWTPRSRDLRRLYLKNCDLRDVNLAGHDLRESNLSLSDLRGADLSGSDLSGSDLEGANLVGSKLQSANLAHCALSATRFFSDEGEAEVSGMRYDGALGLLEGQEEFLRERAGRTR
jgi:DMSO/TMAO reductase YedYZ molybdopterin-dependent catalytic subunit